MKTKIIIGCLLSVWLASAAAQGNTDKYPLSAFEYKQKVLEYSRQIKQSAQQRIAMQEAVKVAKTAFLPAFDASGSFQYRINDYSMDFGEMAIPMANETYSVEAGVAQPIYTGGSIYNNYKATQIKSRIAEKTEELTTDNIIHSAEMSYWGAVAQKESYQVICRYVEIIQNLYDVLADRFKDGYISKTDLLQTESRLKDADLQKINTWKSYQLALQNLNVLMGNSPMDPVNPSDSISTYIMIPLKVGSEVAMLNRPEYAISGMNIEYQKRQINLAKSKYNPTFAIGFKETWGTQMLNLDGTTMFNSIVYASIKIPLFNWGARFKTVNSQRAILKSYEYELDATRDQVTQEVSKAWTNLTVSNKQIEVAQANCRIAEESLELNTFSYNEGKLPIIDVLSAQLGWVQSYSNMIQSWYQQKVAIADYNKAVGLRQMESGAKFKPLPRTEKKEE